MLVLFGPRLETMVHFQFGSICYLAEFNMEAFDVHYLSCLSKHIGYVEWLNIFSPEMKGMVQKNLSLM